MARGLSRKAISANDVILLELRPWRVETEPTPDKPVERIEQAEKQPDPLPQHQFEVMLQYALPQTQPDPREEIPPAPTTSTAQSASSRGAGDLAQPDLRDARAYKRYPQEARGHVLSSHIVTTSGFPAFDEEILALVQRAQPFPVPPPEVPDDEIKFMCRCGSACGDVEFVNCGRRAIPFSISSSPMR